jgi:lipoprotein-anchoring transpeptidase ErfK/SrfK
VSPMKRGLAVSVLVACAAAGVLAAFAVAGGNISAAVTTITTGLTTTAPGTTVTLPITTTTVATTAPTTTTKPRPPKTPKTLPEGVTVGGVPVGNLLPEQAARAIKRYFSTPLVLTLDSRTFRVDPNTLAAPYLNRALAQARHASPFANVPLGVNVHGLRVRAYVAKLAGRVDRKPVSSTLLLRGAQPYLTPDRPGLLLVRAGAEKAISASLRLNVRTTIFLTSTSTQATVTRKNYGPVIVIHRGENQLDLYRGMRLWREFAVATGQAAYPTPLGAFQIVVKWKDPWWYPPASPWAAGEKPVPPGPSNPLGTRWMGLTAPGVGIHGTNNDSSIGYSVSHGCIRMHVPDAEWLFDQVSIGTPVFIVAS